MVPRYLAALLLIPALAQAQLYRWTDDSGKVHYSDQVPPPAAKNVQKKAAAAGDGSSTPLPYALQQAARDFPVTLYTADSCDPCNQARELLNKRGVPYKDVSVSDKEGVEKLKSLSGGGGVPVLSVGREVYRGFDSAAFQAALDAAGYPETSQLPAGMQARQVVKPPEKPARAAAPAVPPPPPPAPDESAPK